MFLLILSCYNFLWRVFTKEFLIDVKNSVFRGKRAKVKFMGHFITLLWFKWMDEIRGLAGPSLSSPSGSPLCPQMTWRLESFWKTDESSFTHRKKSSTKNKTPTRRPENIQEVNTCLMGYMTRFTNVDIRDRLTGMRRHETYSSVRRTRAERYFTSWWAYLLTGEWNSCYFVSVKERRQKCQKC